MQVCFSDSDGDLPPDSEVPQELKTDQSSKNDGDEPVEKEEGAHEEEYWDMDHHKFEWSDFMMNFDPRSWHALGIVVADSFLNKGSVSRLKS